MDLERYGSCVLQKPSELRAFAMILAAQAMVRVPTGSCRPRSVSVGRSPPGFRTGSSGPVGAATGSCSPHHESAGGPTRSYHGPQAAVGALTRSGGALAESFRATHSPVGGSHGVQHRPPPSLHPPTKMRERIATAHRPGRTVLSTFAQARCLPSSGARSGSPVITAPRWCCP
jgi:hypothetical protein